MRSILASRVLPGGAAVLFSVVLTATGAHADAPEVSGAGGNSAEHRRDADARPQHDDQHASANANAAAGPTTATAAAPLDDPQPPSNADFSGNGANDHGAYDSTRDGSPSENGNGDGAAIGKPCAGCVGKADNKNPQGQFPDGSDANKGYECDTNRGIGQTNPAHTGCVTASGGGTTVDGGGTQVLGAVFTAPVVASTAAAPPAGAVLSSAAVAPAAAAPLAATGAPLALVAALGIALVAIGALLRRKGAHNS